MFGVDQNRNNNATSVVAKHGFPEFAVKDKSSAAKVFLSANAMTQFKHARQMYLASVTTHIAKRDMKIMLRDTALESLSRDNGHGGSDEINTRSKVDRAMFHWCNRCG